MCVGYIDESRKRGANVNVFVETGETGEIGQQKGEGGERVGVGTRRQGCVGRLETDIDRCPSKSPV